MKTGLCPDPERLQQWLLGKMPLAELEELGEHLSHCSQCAAYAETIVVGDDLTAALQAPQIVDPHDAQLVQAIRRAQHLADRAETVKTDKTITIAAERVSAGDTSQTSDSDTTSHPTVDFLGPAQQADEIGRLGDYRVLEVMGVGGMGVVFRAEDPVLKRFVALKAMKPDVATSRSAKDRFLKEARATASIEHDNIVPIYQVGEDRGIPFIAMQLLRGESLQTRLQRQRRLSQAEAVRVGRDVAEGLAAAHQRQLIHRDIKPDNIWLDTTSGHAKILDFGLVRSASDETRLTQSGMVLGTPRYMAPEQVDGQEVDHRSDLFSLGSVLYHLVSGQPPFKGGSLTATLIAVAHQDPEPIDQIYPDTQPELVRLIMQLLSKDCAQRPQSAQDVANRLAAIERQLPSAASDDSAPINQDLASSKAVITPTVETPQANTFAASRRTIMWIGGVIGLAASLLLVLWAAGIIFKVETAHGTIVIEIDGAGKGVEINVAEDNTVTIDDPNDGQPIRVTVDRERNLLRLEKKGFRSAAEDFDLETPDGRRVRVTFIPLTNEPRIPADVPADPNVLTVAQDGSGQYRTLNEALSNVKSGMTIRVLDRAVYREILMISSKSRHADLTIESTSGATLLLPTSGVLVLIRGVPGITLRGFTLKTTSGPAAGCVVTRGAYGVTFEDLTVIGMSNQGIYGMSLEGLNTEEKTPNVVIRNCLFRGGGLGVRISGVEDDYVTAMTCRGIVVADNRFEDTHQAITFAGDVRDLIIAGNRISRAAETGIQLQNLVAGADNIQLLNNTMFECVGSVQLWDTMARGDNVRVANNLTLSPDIPDWIFVDNGGSPHVAQGPGDGNSVVQHWQLSCNWRGIDAAVDRPGWIPPGPEDVLDGSLKVLSLDSTHADFLRPAKDSPLSSSGAGNEDPTLPKYVGALPPPEMEPWDWVKSATSN